MILAIFAWGFEEYVTESNSAPFCGVVVFLTGTPAFRSLASNTLTKEAPGLGIKGNSPSYHNVTGHGSTSIIDILETKLLRQEQKTRILGRECFHLYIGCHRCLFL